MKGKPDTPAEALTLTRYAITLMVYGAGAKAHKRLDQLELTAERFRNHAADRFNVIPLRAGVRPEQMDEQRATQLAQAEAVLAAIEDVRRDYLGRSQRVAGGDR